MVWKQCNKIEIGINDHKQVTAGYIARLKCLYLQSDRNSSRPPISLNCPPFLHSPVALCLDIWETKCGDGMLVPLLQKHARHKGELGM